MACFREVSDFPICRRDACGALFQARVGKTLYAMGRYTEALEAFETAMTLRNKLEKANFVLRLQNDLHWIGQTNEKLGNYQQALKALQERGHKQGLHTAKSLARIGSVCECVGRLEEAHDYLGQALELYLLNVGDFPRSKSVAEVYTALGNVAEQRGDSVTAVENYRLGVEVYQRGGRSEQDKLVQNLIRKISDLEHHV